MNNYDRKKRWDEMIKKSMNSEKHFSRYGLTNSLQSHYTRFAFYEIIYEHPSITLTQKEDVISKFLAYLKLIDLEIESGMNNIEKT